MLVGASLFTAVLSSSYGVTDLRPKPQGIPYTKDAPKRTILQHIMRVDGDGRVANRSISVCSMDAIPISTPGILPASLASLEPEPFDARDWVSFYPLNFLITGASFRDSTSDRQNGTLVDHQAVPTLSKAPFLYSAADALARYARDGYQVRPVGVTFVAACITLHAPV